MSFFDQVNEDALRGSVEDGSVGPRLGFQESIQAAWDATTKAHSLLAVEQGLRAVEQAQIKKIREAGLRPPNSLDDSEDAAPILGADNSDRNPLATTFRQGRYSAAAQSIVDGGGWYTDEMVAQRDEQLRTLQNDHPELGIQTYGEMFKKVQADAQEAEKRSQLPKTVGGHVGAFIGAAAGSLDPSSNPLNFATMGVGGGTGVLGRAAVQGAVQGSAEAVNLAASDPENILLGQQRTPGEDVSRIAMAGLAGAGGDLLLSGAGAAVRKMRTGRWFADQPLPPVEPPKPQLPTEPAIGEVPAPMKPGLPLHEYPDWESFVRAHDALPSLYGKMPEAQPRTAIDLNYVASELSRWDGPAPWELRPPETATAPFVEPRGVEVNIAPGSYTRYIDSLETVHDIARRLDPELFKTYDTLQQQIVDLRGSIEAEKKVQTFFDADETARRARELAMREQIQRYDQQMRDLAPLVARAYGMAEKEWRSTPIDFNTLDFFRSIEESGAKWRYRGEGEPSLTERPPRLQSTDAPPVMPTTTNDAIPAASMEPGIDKRLNVDADTAPERAKQTAAHTVEKITEKAEQFAGHAEKVAKVETAEIPKQTQALEERLTQLREQRSAAAREKGGTKSASVDEAIAKTEKELDELHYVTFPDGRKLHLDNDYAPLIRDDGKVEQVSVRDFLKEMAKDQDALKSVVTCSRPS